MRVGYVFDTDVGNPVKNRSDLTQHLRTCDKIQSDRDAHVDGIHTRVIERGQMFREVVYLRIVANQQDAQIFKEGLFSDFNHWHCPFFHFSAIGTLSAPSLTV